VIEDVAVRDLLTVADVARLCHLHEVTVRRHIAAGRLVSVRVGGGVRVRREDLEAFIKPRSASTDGLNREGAAPAFSSDDPLFGLIGTVHDEPWVSGEKHRVLADAQPHGA
jgi:excisionase family DNA binding protein